MPRLCKSKINFLLEEILSKKIKRYGRIQWYIFGLCNSIGPNLLGFLTYPKHESVDFLADILIRKTTAALAQLQQQIQENYIFLLCLKRVSIYVCTALLEHKWKLCVIISHSVPLSFSSILQLACESLTLISLHCERSIFRVVITLKSLHFLLQHNGKVFSWKWIFTLSVKLWSVCRHL